MIVKNKIFSKLLKFFMIILICSTFLLNDQILVYGQKINTSYIYFGDTNTFIKNVDSTNGSLNTVYPSFFDLNEDGSLKLTNKVDKDFVNEMHKRNIKVVPFLSNHWNQNIGRAALSNKYNLVKEIKDAVYKYNLDGINVDIENVTHVDKYDYTEFVRLLRNELPSDKEISVAVAANPSGWDRGWQASYDYENLAKYSDYLWIMAYDESYQGSKSGPIASISFVENSIKYALKYVPSEKIVLGVPFYGRYWKVGDQTGGYGASLKKIEETIKKYNGSIVFDSKSKSPKATVYAPDGTYIYWYENEESIKEKLKLVQKYNLKGSGSWSLGQETKNIWNNYNLWLNGRYFSDIDNHWAYNSILFMDKKGWMKGVSTSQFAPNREITRAEAAVILVRALGLNDETNTSSFTDVSSSYWASKEIEIAKKHEILEGKGNNMFYPTDIITREEMAVILDRLLDKENDNKTDNFFKDINIYDWSYESIIKMSSNGIFKGYDDGNFYPKRKLTRAQMAALMDRISTDIESSQSQIN